MTPSKSTILIALVATVVRLIFFTQHLSAPLVDHPVLDANYYQLAAQSLARGELEPGFATGFRALLYPQILAAISAVAGEGAGLLWALALQHAIGVGVALLVAALARRLFASEAAALAAGLLYALAPVPLFFEGELLVDSLFTATVALQLLLLARADEASGRDRRRALLLAVAAGALIAVGIRLRPNHLLFAAALPLLLLPRSARRARARLVGSVIVGCALTLVALAASELPAGGRFQLLPSAGGVNLYLGNKRTADGMIPKQDWTVTYPDAYRDSVEVFAEQAFRRDRGLAPDAPIAPGALSRYWIGRVADEVAADPLGRLALLGRKALLLLWNAEIPNNRSFAFAAREEAPLLAWLPARFALLLALAAAGALALARARREPETAPGTAAFARDATVLFLAVHAAGVVLYFVNDRYRLPLAPALAAVGGGGLAQLATVLASRRWRPLAAPAAVAGAALLFSLPNWSGVALPTDGRDLLFRSTAWLARGELALAHADAQRATELEPLELPAWLQLGHVAFERGDDPEAAGAYLRVLALVPEHTAALTQLGELALRTGDAASAYAFTCRALAAEPGYPPPRRLAAWIELRAGLDERAERNLALLPERARGVLRVRLAEAELARRRSGAARIAALGIVPGEEEEATALWTELEQPLDPSAIVPCAEPTARGPQT